MEFRFLMSPLSSKQPLQATTKRSQGVVDQAGGKSDSPPLSQWSEQDLEHMIKQSVMFREYANELRSAHAASKNGLGNGRASDSRSEGWGGHPSHRSWDVGY